MEKNDVIKFFDGCAPWWDDDMIRNEEILSTIFTLSGVTTGMDVLDVACGTGVLFPDYLNRSVASVTGIDISPEMVKIAASKFPQVNVVCGDVETTEFDKQFDLAMVYNAFPHFPDPEALVQRLANLTKLGGRLTVAHGMSRAALTDHHKRASKVSIELLHEQELAALFAPWFDVDVVISTDRMYMVSGVRRDGMVHSHGGRVHAHSHGHDHGHSHDHEYDHCDTPLDELLALMNFMVKHNDAHAQELAELADQLKSAGRNRAFNKVMDIVSDFDMVNARLDSISQELSSELEL